MDPVTIEDYKDLLDEEKKLTAELGEMNQALRKQNGDLEAERDGARLALAWYADPTNLDDFMEFDSVRLEYHEKAKEFMKTPSVGRSV